MMLITFGQILEIGTQRLKQANIDNAEQDAQSLLLYMMNEDRSFIYIHKNDGTDEAHAEHYFSLIDRRAEGEPLQYITGEQEFMGLPFKVTPAVLIPRQDTETLMETAILLAKDFKAGLSVLDMCTGSGAIAVSAAHFMPKAKITACDISTEALAIAAENAEKNGVSGRIRFQQSDLFTLKGKKDKPMKDKFHMILSNPPYIESDVIETLQVEVKDYEPRLALDGGADGLDFYRRLAEESADRLKKNGYLIMEIGFDQGQAVTDLLKETGRFKDIFVHKDLARLDRVITARLA